VGTHANTALVAQTTEHTIRKHVNEEAPPNPRLKLRGADAGVPRLIAHVTPTKNVQSTVRVMQRDEARERSCDSRV
jgi:hypothetical protein